MLPGKLASATIKQHFQGERKWRFLLSNTTETDSGASGAGPPNRTGMRKNRPGKSPGRSRRERESEHYSMLTMTPAMITEARETETMPPMITFCSTWSFRYSASSAFCATTEITSMHT